MTSAPIRALGAGGWDSYLSDRFPGFLLPASEHHAVGREIADRFLARLTGNLRSLFLLEAASLIAARSRLLSDYAVRWLPDLLKVLPSRAEVQQRNWRGGFQGRLDIPATQALHLAGQSTTFVTRNRRRAFDLPENLFLKSTVQRTADILAELRRNELLDAPGWSRVAREAESHLCRALLASPLRDLPVSAVDSFQVQACRNARHPAYALALEWHVEMVAALDADDPVRRSAIIAEGALRPLDTAKRFELATLVRLIEALWNRLAPYNAWTFERSVVVRGRDEVAMFRHRAGAAIRVFYDQVVLPADGTLGARDSGVAHYFASGGRLRPDITLQLTQPSGARSYVAIEVKLSDSVSYAGTGFLEAIAYRHEYADDLGGWPKAMLVTSLPVVGEPREEDEVVAVDWMSLPRSKVIDGILQGMPDSG